MAPLAQLRQKIRRMVVGRARERENQDEAPLAIGSSSQGRILNETELEYLWGDEEFTDPMVLRDLSHLMFQTFCTGGTHAHLMASLLAVERASKQFNSTESLQSETRFKVMLELADRFNCVYEQTRSEQHMINALVMAAGVVLLAKEDDPRKRALALDIRAATYELKYHHSVSLLDLERSIRDSEEAWILIASLWPPELYHIPMNLANKLESRFIRTRQHSDIDRSIDLMREVNEKTRVLLKPELTRAVVAHNLAIKLYLRGREAEQSARENDIEESLRWYQEAVDLTPLHHPFKWVRLLNLTRCCVEKAKTRDWQESGNDVEAALKAFQELLYIVPPKDTNRREVFSNMVSLNDIIWEKCPQPDRKLQGIDDAIRWQEELVLINARGREDSKTEEKKYVECIIKLHNLFGRKALETKDEAADQRAQSLRDEIRKYMTLHETAEVEEEHDHNNPTSASKHPESSARIELQARLDREQSEATAIVRAENPIHIYIDSLSEVSSNELEFENYQRKYKTIVAESISTLWHSYRSKSFAKQLAQAPSFHDDRSLRMKMVHAMEQHATKLDQAYNFSSEEVIESSRKLLTACHGWLICFLEETHRDTSTQWEALLLWLRESNCNAARYGDILGMLALAISDLWSMSRNDSILELTVPVHQAALRGLVDGNPLRALVQVDLAGAYSDRAIRYGDASDLKAGIEVAEAAVTGSLGSRKASMVWIEAMSTLALLHNLRYESTGLSSDLRNALTWLAQSALHIDRKTPGWAQILNNLAVFMEKDANDLGLRAGIEFARAGLEAEDLPRDVEIGLMNIMSLLLDKMFCIHEELKYELKAVFLREKILEVAPSNHPSRALYEHNLSVDLRRRFERDPEKDDKNIDRAVSLSRHAAARTPKNHPWRSRFSSSLFITLEVRRQHHPDQGLAESVEAGMDAFENGTKPMARITAARQVAELLVAENEMSKAYSMYEKAIGLLEMLSPRWLSHSDKQELLSVVTGMQSDAVCLALALGRPHMEALGLLERGRALVASSILDTRSDLTVLENLDPELCRTFKDARDMLSRDASEGIHSFTQFKRGHEGGQLEREMADSRITELLGRIRQLDGMDDFLRTPSLNRMKELAASGPVVVVICGKVVQRSYAILVTVDKIQVIQLDLMSFQDVAYSAVMLRSVYKGTMKDFFERGQRMMKILDWLWRVAVRPVLDILAPNAEGTTSGLPRLWWIPVGLLSRFPFHAAMEEGGDRNARAYERVMSCYAPSLKSLRFIRDQPLAAISRATSRFLAITVEETGQQGYPKLAGVNQEALDLATIFSQTPEDCILHRPTAARALKAIQDSNLVHFACHGKSDPVNPSNSRLILVKADPDNVERIDPLTVGDLMNGKAAHGGIAFLRACFTADNSAVRLIDEVIHLASAFQLAGFSHVFGTMWNTRNSACAEVSKRFYLHLLEPSLNEHPHYKVAKAFHMAVKEWMDSEGTYENPLLWASFVHYGA